MEIPCIIRNGELLACRANLPCVGQEVWWIVTDEPVELPDDGVIAIWVDEPWICAAWGWVMDELLEWKETHPRQRVTKEDIVR